MADEAGEARDGRERLVAETRGNPLALLELPREMTADELAGGFGLPDTSALSGRIEDSFRTRLALLPAETQRLLLVAAAEPIGDPVLVWRAAERLGIGVDAAAETDRLLAIGLVVSGYLAFGAKSGSLSFAEPRFYAPVPFLFWAAIRFGMAGAAGAVAIIAFLSVEAALEGRGDQLPSG